MEAREVDTSPKILQKDIKAVDVCAVRYVLGKGSALYWRTTVVQKHPADYLEKFIAY